MYRAGLRELRLIYSSKPKWYFRKAENTLKSIFESYLTLFGVNKFLEGLASPIFFDALSAAAHLDDIGGGATTIIAVSLKNYLRPEMGLAMVGGKRLQGFRVPAELDLLADQLGFDEKLASRLKYSSRMVAKVDTAAIQDGFQLYLHLMVVSSNADWVVIQQGIKPMMNLVRRYHWISWKVGSFVDEPHSGIVSASKEEVVLDMTDKESREARKTCVELVNNDLQRLRKLLSRPVKGQLTITDFDGGSKKKKVLSLPKIKWSSILNAHKNSPSDFEELLSLRGVGPATVRFLATASAELYGVVPSLSDPAMLFDEIVSGVADDKKLYELIDAIKEAGISLEEKKKAINRVSSIFLTLDLS